jgi:predicted RNase H-like nuclease (RuvC/YqgF family)
MNWTPELILGVFQTVAAAIITVGGWYVVSKLNKANTEKAKSEATQNYQEMLNTSSDREKKLTARIEILEKDINKYQEMLAGSMEREKRLFERVELLESYIKNLNMSSAEKDKENSLLKMQVAELLVQSNAQARQIEDMESELRILRAKRK